MAQLVVNDLKAQHVALAEEQLAKPLPKNAVATPTKAHYAMMKKLFLVAALDFTNLMAHAQPTPPAGPLVVATNGSGQYRTVQAAINAAPSQSATPALIQLKPGTYQEKVVVPALKTHLVLRGTSETAATSSLTPATRAPTVLLPPPPT